ncbi:MAG: hypothetical protein RIS04_1461 [Pseudomonadota bacterium]|uniref:TRAP transporter small permease n=1 Tax=Limnohabitans sp. TaxID=1907725 RepID=UPI00311EED5F
MADLILSEDNRTYTGAGWLLDKTSKAMAVASGLSLIAMALMSLRSIVGRSFFDAPLLGDYELVQMFSAIAVSLSLPYANWVKGHVIVDFFTAKASASLNRWLDGVAQLLIAVFSAVLCWNTLRGLIDLKSTGDASMLLEIPTWWTYGPIAAAFAVLCATALYAITHPERGEQA